MLYNKGIFKNMYYIKLQNLTEINLFLDSTKLSELNKQRSSHKQIHNKGEDCSNNNTNNKKPKPFWLKQLQNSEELTSEF